MEDEESLKSDAVFRQLADSFQDEIDDLFADRVVAPSVVVCRVLFSVDHLLRVKQTTVWTHAYLICSVEQYFNFIYLFIYQ